MCVHVYSVVCDYYYNYAILIYYFHLFHIRYCNLVESKMVASFWTSNIPSLQSRHLPLPLLIWSNVVTIKLIPIFLLCNFFYVTLQLNLLSFLSMHTYMYHMPHPPLQAPPTHSSPYYCVILLTQVKKEAISKSMHN